MSRVDSTVVPRAPRRRWTLRRARLLTAGLVLAITVLTAAEPTGPAAALPTTGPSQPAATATRSTPTGTDGLAALRSQVEQLEEDVEVAAEAYADAQADLAVIASRQADAERSLLAARTALADQRALAGKRVRAVQQTGGTRLALTAGALRGEDPADVLDGYRAVATVLGSDTQTVTAARSRLDDAVSASQRVITLREQASEASARADAEARRAQTSLNARRQLMAAAGAALTAQLAAQRAQQEAAATTTATSSLAALGADPTLAAPTTGPVAAALDAARSRMGAPYVWGATGPDAFDCSGLVQWAYAQAGVAVPRTTRQQYAALPRVPLAELAPGDLVLYASGDDPSTIHHVVLYLGGGVAIHAPHTGDVVRTTTVTRSAVYAVVRPVASSAP